PVPNVLDHPALQEDLGGDDGPRVEDLEALQVDLHELLLEARVREPALGDPAMERHLPALEAFPVAEAAAALLALLSPARRLPQAAAGPASHALALAARTAAFGRLQVVQAHRSSSLSRRWRPGAGSS